MIHFIERNVHGGYIVYGIIGIRQYYGYPKREAMRRYREEARATIIRERR